MNYNKVTKTLHVRVITALVVLVLSTLSPQLMAFCGFYVAKANANLFNQSSQVVFVRDGNRNVVTMSNDYQG